VVAPFPPLALTTEKTLPRMPSVRLRRCAVVSRTKASRRSVVVVGLNELARSSAHRVDDNLRLVEDADGENGILGHFLVQEFNRAQSQLMIVRGNVDEGYVGIRSAYPAGYRIGPGYGKTGARMHSARNAGAIDQHLQQRALLVVTSDNDD